MADLAGQRTVQVENLGALLRSWRRQRGKSQLELALDAGVSQRHISFVESGRSQPSRDFLLLLAATMDIPLRERNVLLLAAGYAPLYAETAWDAPQMEVIRHAIDRLLVQQEPHPALVLDRYWNVLQTNEAAPRFFKQFIDLDSRKRPRNLLDLMFDPAGMRPFIADWESVAVALLERVRREAVGYVLDTRTAELLRHLETYPGVKKLKTMQRGHLPMFPVTFLLGEKRLSYFSILSTVGLPLDITAQEFRIECMFPVKLCATT